MLFTILILFIIFLLLGIPIGFAIGALSASTFVIFGKSLLTIPQRMFTGIDSFTFLAIPLFIMASQIMSASGITKRIVNFSNDLVGHITGGLALVNVLGSMIFAGIQGSAVADAAGLGPIEIQMMDEAGYPRDFSAAVTAASAILGPIIPPSVVMIEYVVVSGNVTVSELFLAGFIPGILMGLALMICCYFISKKMKYPRSKRWCGFKKIFISFLQTLPILFVPIIILGGILGGVFTATESAAIAVLYSLILSILVLKTLKFRDLPAIFLETAKTTSSVFFIIATAMILSWILTILQIPQKIADFFLSYTHNSTILFLFFSNILLLIAGSLLDLTAALIILVPILSPAAVIIGIDPLHFGLIVIVNLCIGLITPPIGMVLFVVSSIAKISLTRMYRVIQPFIVIEIAILFVITYIPFFTTFVPRLFR